MEKRGPTQGDGAPEAAQVRTRLVVTDLAEAVAHEFNNLFNNILLQLEVLKRQGVSAELAAKAVGMQERCRQAANLLKRLQRCSDSLLPAFSPTDLNQIVREVAGGQLLGTGKQWSRPVRLELDAALPPFPSAALDLTRLVSLLLEHATAVTPAGSAITVRTVRVPAGCQLVVEDGGPVLPAEGQRKFLEPFAVTRPGGDDWTPSVCKILARRLQGSLRVANRGEEGMTFAIELPLEPETPASSSGQTRRPARP
jgi:signal transduction histidine kinase